MNTNNTQQSYVSPSGLLMGVEEAADFLGISASQLRQWRRCRRVPFVKVGSRIYFKRDDLIQWIETMKIPAL